MHKNNANILIYYFPLTVMRYSLETDDLDKWSSAPEPESEPEVEPETEPEPEREPNTCMRYPTAEFTRYAERASKQFLPE